MYSLKKPGLTVLQSPNQMGTVDFSKRRIRIFIAGGISNCPNWQQDFINIYDVIRPEHRGSPTILVNPRRKGDLARDGEDAREQIIWERKHLEQCTHVIFWFPKESICPITLFELGQWATYKNLNKGKVIVGADPDYPRFFDIQTQLSLVADRNCKISTSIHDLVVRTLSMTVG